MGAVDEVKSRVDIADVIGEYVPLARAGRNLKASCPFHSERTPSFYVFPERQSWRCFGACATGGDAISFVQRAEAVGFGEALRRLAHRAGVALPEPRGREEGERERRLLEANEAAARFFRRALGSQEGREAREYLERRGVSQEAVEAFELGVAPDRWDSLRRALVEEGLSEELLVEAGLVSRLEDGRTRDLFRRRLVFPIRDGGRRLVGFGGRTLGEASPKYLNTPRTGVFDKGHTLYGLDKASESIRRRGEGVVVEGYMDVIAAHEKGYANVVASMGTALTEHQVRQLRGIAPRFVLALDPDVAGQEATLRSLESSWEALRVEVARTSRPGQSFVRRSSPVELRIAVLPEGRDPDRLLRTAPERWEAILEGAEPLLEYLILAESRRHDLRSGEGKGAVAERLVPLMAALNPFDRERYFRRLAEVLGVGVGTLEASVGRPPAQRGRAPQPLRSPLEHESRDRLEEYTLGLVLLYPELGAEAAALREEHFRRAENRAVFTAWSRWTTLESVRVGLEPEVVPHLEELLREQPPSSTPAERVAALEQCTRRLEERRLRSLKEEEAQVLREEWRGGAGGQSPLPDPDLETTEGLRRVFQQGR